MEQRGVRRRGTRCVQDVSVSVVTHAGEVVVTTHLHNDLVLEALNYVKVDRVGVGKPHWVAIVAGTAIDVLNNDKLATVFGLAQLVLQPEHLLHPRLGAVIPRPFAVVVDRVERQDRYFVVQVHSVETPDLKTLANTSNLLLGQLLSVSR